MSRRYKNSRAMHARLFAASGECVWFANRLAAASHLDTGMLVEKTYGIFDDDYQFFELADFLTVVDESWR